MSLTTRPTWVETFFEKAEVMERRSVLPTPVGAVIVQDKWEISSGYNGKPSGTLDIYRQGDYQLDEVHAEQNAIAFAARKGISTDGASLYVTVRPCIHCAKLLIQAGIKRVYCYNSKAKDQEACPDGIDLLHSQGVTVYLYERT